MISLQYFWKDRLAQSLSCAVKKFSCSLLLRHPQIQNPVTGPYRDPVQNGSQSQPVSLQSVGYYELKKHKP
jgi:hypothetical protein